MEASIMVEINGRTNSLKDWAEHYRVPYISAYRRYKRGKVGADIFKIKTSDSTYEQRKTKPETFTAMGQLNISMPQFQIDQLDRIAKLSGTKKTRYAHKVLVDHLKNL